MKTLLAPLGWLYGAVTAARNRLYDRGSAATFGLGAFTVSVGNVTTGGTGKTPLVRLIAEMLSDNGERVCILTRGYGRKEPGKRVVVSDGEAILSDAENAGDEPLELAARLRGRGVVIIADADRVAAGRWALEQYAVTAFILDDGFQHRRVRRDVDIVCIDATDPFGGGRMLPAGRLRESVNGIGRADAVVITRSDLIASADALSNDLAQLAPAARIFRSHSRLSAITPLEEFLTEATNSGSQTPFWHGLALNNDGEACLLAFCGLGNPESFFSLALSECEKNDALDLAMIKKFPDHFAYTQHDIDKLAGDAIEAGISAMLTTAKDAVKLRGLDMRLPCFVVEIEPEIDDPGRFRALFRVPKPAEKKS